MTIPQDLLNQVPLEVLVLMENGTLSPMEVAVLNTLIQRNPNYLQELSERKMLDEYLQEKGGQLENGISSTISKIEQTLEPPSTKDTMKLISYHNQVRKSAMEHLLAVILPPPEENEA